jgi:hypothetical protein
VAAVVVVVKLASEEENPTKYLQRFFLVMEEEFQECQSSFAHLGQEFP